MDRHGNPYFTDAQQIEFLAFYLDHFVGFQGTEYERGIVADAWWLGDWEPRGRCPSLDEARAFLAARNAEPVPAMTLAQAIDDGQQYEMDVIA